MYIVWLNGPTGASPVLCDGLEELPGGMLKLRNPNMTFTLGSTRYRALDYVVGPGMVDSYARVAPIVADEALLAKPDDN